MQRSLAIAIGLALTWAGSVHAQTWAKKMFEETNHDFGTVARATKVEHRFGFKNLYKEDVHVAGVRSSCGCTTPLVTRQTVKTGQTSEIVAHFNTGAFLGEKSATITVLFDRPFAAEVQLHVGGVIRGDVTCTPGEVNFGAVDLGATVERHITVSRVGRGDWQILDARSANEALEVELTETARGRNGVSYDVLVRLKQAGPAGYLNDELTLVTNDRQSRELILTVEGNVAPALSVSPSPLFLGQVASGEQVTRQLVVRGKTPFRILDVTCSDAAFEVRAGGEARRAHVLPLTFRAGQRAGRLEREIVIQTDQGQSASGNGATVRLKAQAVVIAASAATEREEPPSEEPAATETPDEDATNAPPPSDTEKPGHRTKVVEIRPLRPAAQPVNEWRAIVPTRPAAPPKDNDVRPRTAMSVKVGRADPPAGTIKLIAPPHDEIEPEPAESTPRAADEESAAPADLETDEP